MSIFFFTFLIFLVPIFFAMFAPDISDWNHVRKHKQVAKRTARAAQKIASEEDSKRSISREKYNALADSLKVLFDRHDRLPVDIQFSGFYDVLMEIQKRGVSGDGRADYNRVSIQVGALQTMHSQKEKALMSVNTEMFDLFSAHVEREKQVMASTLKTVKEFNEVNR